ncbi:LysR family transcriptional regulator [Sphingomonas sp.]|uniref:LysR family transcriptional regulator n=1 Tax=Sphingomonas sp. TaxID=28214 RepID=UPI0025F2284F|nr:LysR family transcriptional regulator [Sphingomonas sp.]
MFTSGLKAFDAAVRTGSIRKASDSLGVAPSSVSRHVALLEREIGTALFDRKARGVKLTFAGELVADYARSVLIGYDTLRSDLNDLRGTRRRLIRVAMIESIATTGPMDAVKQFNQKYPEVSFELKLLPALRVVEAVRDDECDIGLTFGAEPDHHILTLARFHEPIVVLAPLDHPLAGRERVQLAEVAEFPLALPDESFGVRRIVERASARSAVPLAPTLSTNVFELLREFVRCGIGLALLPQRACRLATQPGLCSIALADRAFTDVTIDLIVLRKRKLPRVVKAFVDLLSREIETAAS